VGKEGKREDSKKKSPQKVIGGKKALKRTRRTVEPNNGKNKGKGCPRGREVDSFGKGEGDSSQFIEVRGRGGGLTEKKGHLRWKGFAEKNQLT